MNRLFKKISGLISDEDYDFTEMSLFSCGVMSKDCKDNVLYRRQTTNAQIRLHIFAVWSANNKCTDQICAVWSVLLLFANAMHSFYLVVNV